MTPPYSTSINGFGEGPAQADLAHVVGCLEMLYGVATGLDHRRLALLLAVLERRAGLPFGSLDVFVNVTGGVRLIEPSTDLAVLAALVSTVHDRPVPADALFLGEVGLGGEIRPVAGVERRLAEAARQGFRRVFLSNRSTGSKDLEVIGLEGIGELTRRLAA